MKTIILVVLMAVTSCCNVADKQTADKELPVLGLSEIRTIEYEGCEYVVYRDYMSGYTRMIHKGNCKYCEERGRNGK